jgi:hypothetical protein
VLRERRAGSFCWRANNLTGSMTRVLELLFGDKNDFVVTSLIAGTTPIQYHRFSEMADDVVERARISGHPFPPRGCRRTKAGQAIRRLGGQSRAEAD